MKDYELKHIKKKFRYNFWINYFGVLAYSLAIPIPLLAGWILNKIFYFFNSNYSGVIATIIVISILAYIAALLAFYSTILKMEEEHIRNNQNEE